MGEFLLMGPRGAGKTTIVRRLQAWSDDKQLTAFDAIPPMRPTEGIEQSLFKARQLNTDETIGFDSVLNPLRITLMEISSVVGIGFNELFWLLQEAATGHAT
jgi:GTPase SAR1 family protein